MSVTNSEAKAPAKSSKKSVKPAAAAALKAALDAAQIEMVPLSALVKSPLNVRTVPYSAESVRGLADTIKSVGLLQNLVVHTLPDGISGVAAGGRRLTALQLLRDERHIDAGYSVAVKRVSGELAVIASMVENDQQKAMHPAEQIAGFRSLSEQGKTAAQIGDMLGYGSRHVQRMLKLANLAPELIALLAEDRLDVEQCQALSLESDPARQVEILERVQAEYSHAPAHLLKRAVTDTEISVRHARFVFIGREAYEAAGGVVREDLFSAEEGDGTADGVLLDRLVQARLAEEAQRLQEGEGWSWSMTRETPVRDYGEDRERYLRLPEPEAQYNPDERQRLDELYATQEATETYEDEADIQALIDDIENAAVAREWTPEQKGSCGVVVSLDDGELCIQRGVRLKAEMPEETGSIAVPFTSRQPNAAEGISVPLLTKMSSERTLAVQAALMQQPQKAVALMVWRMCTCVFSGCLTTTHPFRISLTVSHGSLTENAPSGKDGAAFNILMTERARLKALLPEGWEKDFTTFFDLSGEVLMSLMAFCTACSVDGVQTRDMGHTSRSTLDTVEAAIGFHLRDWWHPTKDNYFSGLKHPQIVASLKEAGLTGAAGDAKKMKKGDAAGHAEHFMQHTRWVPAWLKGPEPMAEADADEVISDTDSTDNDTTNTAHAA